MALGRLRAALGLDHKRPLLYLAKANSIYTGLETHPTIFVACNPALPVLYQQIQDATGSQALVGTGVKGASQARDLKFSILTTSLECERMMVQGLCDASPEQAPSIIAAAMMQPILVGGGNKPLLGLKNALPAGCCSSDANASLLDSTSRKKTFNWHYTLDRKIFVSMPSTPVAHTSIANLTPLTTVGFEVSITINKQPPGAWSQTVYILVR